NAQGWGSRGIVYRMPEAILPCARRAGMLDNHKETVITSAGIIVCICCLFLVYRDLRAISFAGLVTLLASCGLVYLFARLGYLWRGADLIPPSRHELERVYNAGSTVPYVCNKEEISDSIDRTCWGRRRALVIVAMLLTAVGAGCVTVHLLNVAGTAVAEANIWRLLEIATLYALFYWMLASSFVYLLVDYGHCIGQAAHPRKPRGDVDACDG